MQQKAEEDRIAKQEALNKKSLERTKFQKVGKMMMTKRKAPKVEKVVVKAKIYTSFE